MSQAPDDALIVNEREEALRLADEAMLSRWPKHGKPGKDLTFQLSEADLIRLIALARATPAPQKCSKCGQIDQGQTGEYPCSICGLPTVWDGPAAAPDALSQGLEWHVDRLQAELNVAREELEQAIAKAEDLEMQLSVVNCDKAAYWEGHDDAVAGVAGRWKQALEDPIPAPGTMNEPLESLYRRTEALRVDALDARHASAPEGHKCADCTMDREACPTCYHAWWTRRHSNTQQIGGFGRERW